MLLLSKLQTFESDKQQHKNDQKDPVAEDELCDSLNTKGLEESRSNTGIAVVDLADI
jgi:hypothetical protein